MKELKIKFYSEGCKLDGSIYLPEDYKEGEVRPAIIANSGYQGFNAFYPKMFANYFTRAGFVCLGFDYRGFAESEGSQGHVLLHEQLEDVKNALTYAQTRSEIDSERIGLLGWGMGASTVVNLAASDKRVKAVSALNGFYNGERWLRSIHTEESWQDIIRLMEEDRVHRVSTGKSKRVSPFIHYLLDPDTEGYVQNELAPLIERSGEQIDLQFTESIIASNAEKQASLIAPRPLFIAHGKDNSLHPKREAEMLYVAANDPKELYWVDGKHNDFTYTGNEVLEDLVEQLIKFYGVLKPDLKKSLAPTNEHSQNNQ